MQYAMDRTYRCTCGQNSTLNMLVWGHFLDGQAMKHSSSNLIPFSSPPSPLHGYFLPRGSLLSTPFTNLMCVPWGADLGLKQGGSILAELRVSAQLCQNGAKVKVWGVTGGLCPWVADVALENGISFVMTSLVYHIDVIMMS